MTEEEESPSPPLTDTIRPSAANSTSPFKQNLLADSSQAPAPAATTTTSPPLSLPQFQQHPHEYPFVGYYQYEPDTTLTLEPLNLDDLSIKPLTDTDDPSLPRQDNAPEVVSYPAPIIAEAQKTPQPQAAAPILPSSSSSSIPLPQATPSSDPDAGPSSEAGRSTPQQEPPPPQPPGAVWRMPTSAEMAYLASLPQPTLAIDPVDTTNTTAATAHIDLDSYTTDDPSVFQSPFHPANPNLPNINPEPQLPLPPAPPPSLINDPQLVLAISRDGDSFWNGVMIRRRETWTIGQTAGLPGAWGRKVVVFDSPHDPPET